MTLKQFIGVSTALISLSFSQIGTSVVHAATKQSPVASIVVNGHLAQSKVPYVVRNETVWMPMSQVVTALRAMQTKVAFNGHALLINNLASQSSTLGIESSHTITVANGASALYRVPIMKLGTHDQLYIPIWYVMNALQRGNSGYRASWKPGSLRLENDATGAPSTTEIERVMKNTTESKDHTEHFVLSGRPVHYTVANGDTVTAAIGMRYPTADGYGQAVFFFHNHQFVGFDSNVEKIEIRSIHVDPNGGATFDVSYANYAPNDPMVNPSLPAVTVQYSWTGSKIVTEGVTTVPSGATDKIQMNPSGAFAPTSSLSTKIPTVVRKKMQSALPSGAKWTSRPGTSTPYLSVDLTGKGQNSYAAVYKNPTTQATGLIVASLVNYQWKVVWNKPLRGMMLRELSAADMTGDGLQEIAVQTYVGDGANAVLILKSISGKLKPVLDASGAADIGDFDQDGTMEVATWNHDTGPLENIQMYAWNAQTQSYAKANSNDFPEYFANVATKHYKAIERHAKTSTVPPKMIDYGLADAYDHAGLYKEAVEKARLALAQGTAAYPSDQRVKAVMANANASLTGVHAYAQASKKIKSTIEKIITKYSNNLNPLANSVPQITRNQDGSYSVHVIGAFHTFHNGTLKWAQELHFDVSRDGSTVNSVKGKTATGNVSWQTK